MPHPRPTASIAGHPLHAMLVQFPVVCFVLTLLSDIVYAKTVQMQWANMSAWLLLIGLIAAVFAVLAGIVDFLGEQRIHELRAVWVHVIGNALALALAILNAFVHSRDAYTSVVPLGLTLSALTVLVMLVTSWFGWSLVHRHGVVVEPEAL
jgi:uncharacterized membrane protein